MTSTHAQATAAGPLSRAGLGRAVLTGAGAGVLASLAMAMYAMIHASAVGKGFFTPLYQIASLVISPSTMMTSAHHAAAGSGFYFSLGPALTGAMIHMMTGAVYGVLLALVVSRLSLSGSWLVTIGLGYGVLVFAISSWIALPVMAALLGSGDQIAHMAQNAGYLAFLVNHLVYGAALGALLTLRHADPTSSR
jgi:hypothetical protein